METALNLFSRYYVTKGDLNKKNIKVLLEELPLELLDQISYEEKLKRDQMKLLSIVNYFRDDKCRKSSLETYFGYKGGPDCGTCDNCK